MKVSLLTAAAAVALISAPCLAATTARPAPVWPQAKSDLPADPSAVFGVLPNGMRYAIMHNATPAGQTAIRLRIGSGSLEETDDEQGLAHVLEHMSFKGSKHVPPGQEIKILQRDGLAFGPDTNASTSWLETVYQLDLPKSTESLIDTGLMLMRETAGELLILPQQLATERGVVLSEERLRDTPQYRAEKAQIDLLAHGQRITERYPIGKVDVIEHAPASLVRKFYEANYRPDRATLIVVGDFDPKLVEAKIRAKFSNWKPVGPETAQPDLGQVEKRGLTVKVVDLPGAQTMSMVAWARPYDSSPDDSAKRRRETVENLALQVLNRRLARLAEGANPPFIGADSLFDNLLHSDKVAVVEAASAPGDWKPALTAIDQEARRLTTYGVSQAELDEEIARSRAALVTAAAGAATRPTPQLAEELVSAVNDDEVYTSPAEDLKVFDAAVKGITPQEVDEAARRIFAGSGPLVELETPTPPAGGEQAVAEAFAQAAAAPVSAPAAQATVAWPYASFGAPGKVESRREIADLGVTQVRFANGVALSVKPTKFRTDQILVAVDFGHGREGLPSHAPSVAWAASALIQGGFKAISYQDSQRALAGRVYAAELGVGDEAFTLKGATRPQDLSTQLQVLAAYVADPGFRAEAFDRTRSALLSALPQIAATPEGVFFRDGERLLHGGDARWGLPSAAELTAAKPADLEALLAGPLAHSPIEITIVGDVSADQAIAEVAKTFGALPARPAEQAAPAGGDEVRFPAPVAAPVSLHDSGRADQALAILAWPVTGIYTNLQASRADMLAGEVLQNRVLAQIRQREGATYSPETQVALSESFPSYGVALTAVEMPPQKIPGFFSDMAKITADMRDKPATADELERARNPRLATIRKAQLTNEYWLQRLDGSIAEPRRLDIIRTTLPDYAKVTAADIQAAAKRMFAPDRAWKLTIDADGAP